MTKASDNLYPRVLFDLQTVDQSAPADSSWKVYTKADGVYARSSNAIAGPFGTGGSGAPDDAQYIVGALDGTLSAEKVKAALYKNYDPDEYPLSGTSLTDEFDDSSLDGAWTWDTAPSGTVSESVYPGFLHVEGGTDSSPAELKLRRAYTPGASTAFTVATKVTLGFDEDGLTLGEIGIALLTSADAVISEAWLLKDSNASYVEVFDEGGPLGDLVLSPGQAGRWLYLLITRDVSDLYKFYYSWNGITWGWLGSSTSSTTVAKVALVYANDTDAVNPQAAWDFLRVFSSVTQKIGA